MSDDEKTCPKCAETVKAAAVVCKHCGYDFKAGAMPKTAGDIQKETQKAAQKGLAVGCGTLIALAALVTMCSMPASIPEQPGPTAKADALALFGKVTKAAGECDVAFSRMATELSGKDEIRTFRAAEVAAAACAGVNGTITSIEIPTSLGKIQHDAAKSTLELCGAAYVDRWSAADSMKQALDGKDSVSVRSELQRAIAEGAARGKACAEEMADMVLKAGGTSKDLEVFATGSAGT